MHKHHLEDSMWDIVETEFVAVKVINIIKLCSKVGSLR